MAKVNSMVVLMSVMMVASLQLQSTVAQTRHVVGGELGWTVPPNGAASYTSWASEQTFKVGDTLVFNFTNGAHNVAEVSQAAYGPCITASPMSTITKSPATLTLRTSGNHYYVCIVGSHCRIGQKLTINVVAASSSTRSTEKSPVGAPTSTMSSSPTTPSPPSPSSATRTVVLSFTLLSLFAAPLISFLV